jgi:hypothetical protein
MHDQGPLPELKEGGPIALLIGCVDAAKAFNNDFLTKAIETEKTMQPSSSEQQQLQQQSVPFTKKSKTDTKKSMW